MPRRQTKICAHCQQPFIAKRKDNKTCSAQCRKALSRARQAVAREAQRVEVRVEQVAKEAERLLEPANATGEGFIAASLPGNVVSPAPQIIPPVRPRTAAPQVETPGLPTTQLSNAQRLILSESQELDPDGELEFASSTKSNRRLLKLMTGVMAVLLVMAGIVALLDFTGLLPSNYSQKITVNKLGNNVQNVNNQITQLNKQVTTLKGQQGLQGVQGIQGSLGIQGATGPQGPSGINGVDGAAGSQGPAGPEGPQGPQGPSGSATCPNGPCVSLQSTSPGVQEGGNISITGNINIGGIYMINGAQIAVANLADSGNIARLNGTGPQTFTGN